MLSAWKATRLAQSALPGAPTALWFSDLPRQACFQSFQPRMELPQVICTRLSLVAQVFRAPCLRTLPPRIIGGTAWTSLLWMRLLCDCAAIPAGILKVDRRARLNSLSFFIALRRVRPKALADCNQFTDVGPVQKQGQVRRRAHPLRCLQHSLKLHPLTT